ncbi:YihY family inner membrane protein [Thalassolituus sp.]|jgi:membrane protein|uniref:YihY family inner membrane protein n=1 Tax=Thalassolituus sp. TaxID=2030822 RepID=UPI003511F7C4
MKPRFIPDLRHVGRVLWQTLKRYESMERRKEAAALTYTTLFALVPVITVSYSILSAIPTLQEMGQEANQQLLSYVLPQGSEVITDYLQQFSQQARKLTWIGIVFLFFTSIMLLQTIEQQFNRIWNVDTSRSRIQTFFRYWAVLSLGPLLFGAGVATSSVLASMSMLNGEDGGALTELARLIPWLLTTAAITVLYVMVPNCKVPVPHAVIAAFLVATTFEVGKFAFSETLGLFPSYKLIYGAFAAVPLFLLWVYVSWMLLLLGAELTYGLSHYRRPGTDHSPVHERIRLAALLTAARDSTGALPEADMRRQLRDLDAARLTSLLNEYRDKGWTLLSDDGRWAWVRDPATLTLGEFFAGQTLDELTEANADNHQDLLKLRGWQKSLADVTMTSKEVTLKDVLPSLEEPSPASK